MPRLSAGAWSTVITPPVGVYMGGWGLRKGKATGVHDELRTRALVLDDQNERLAIVSLDVGFVYAELTADIRRRIRALTGIEEKNVMLNASHTHTRPMMPGKASIWRSRGESQYMSVFPEYVAGTVAAANNLLQPALVSSSASELTGITINRRHPEQAADTRLNVLRVSSPAGKVIATVMNFGCHPLLVGGQYLLWSADFPGPACTYVEEAFKGSVCLYVNGASGDVHPWDLYFGNEHPKHAQTHEEAEKMGRVLGSETVRLAEMPSRPPRAVELRSESRTLKLSRRKIPSEKEAQELLDNIMKRHKPWTKDTWDPGDTVSNIFRRHPSPYLIASANQLLDLAEEKKREMSTEMQAFGLGDTAMVAIPGEPFSNLGIEIREKSKAGQTFIMTYANDMIGYIPTNEAFEECEDVGLEEGFGLTYCYGATLPVSSISKEGIRKLTSSAIDMASRISR